MLYIMNISTTHIPLYNFNAFQPSIILIDNSLN